MENNFPSTFWDQRYATETYVYGEAPNVFFKAQIDPLKPGKMLLPFEGEGRNAVYAAHLGWEVDCFDFSTSGKNKAEQLAEKYGVRINYTVCDFRDFDWPEQHYDLIGLFYAHLPEKNRLQLHQRIVPALEIGGVLLLEAFDSAQLGRSSGGPQNLEMLYNDALLHADFDALRNRVVEKIRLDLNEGLGHAGEAEIVRLAGMR